MADNRWLQVLINGEATDIEQTDDVPVSISYALEDAQDFQTKKSSVAGGLKLPATRANNQRFNSFFNPAIADLTPGDVYRSMFDYVIKAKGIEITKGKALLSSAEETDKPEGYELDCFGENGDWAIAMRDMTLWDALSGVTHLFTKAVIESSWDFDGTDPTLDYTYAPVRYGRKWSDNDDIITPLHMRPSLSIYFMLKRAFASVGYQISSQFMDLPYFRRQVMPWVWGDFLKINSKELQVLKFRARMSGGTQIVNEIGVGSSVSIGLYMGNSNGDPVDNETTLGAYDNSNNYAWDGIDAAEWTYQAPYFTQFGSLIVAFNYRFDMFFNCTWNSNVSVYVEWYINGVLSLNQNVIALSAPATGSDQFDGIITSVWESPALTGGDVISARVRVTGFKTNLGQVTGFFRGDIEAVAQTPDDPNIGTWLEVAYFKKPLGGTVDLKLYDKFKEYKLLDLVRGCIDNYDLQPGTDATTKTVYFEPLNDYSTDSDITTLKPGYIKKDVLLDWGNKRDNLQRSRTILYSGSERELLFQFKEDNADGGLNIYNGRFSLTAGQSKYLFPNRFAAGQKQYQNRFFSALIHFRAAQFNPITGVTPQFICLAPENIANTSANEAEASFQPKIAYYKGMCDRSIYGGWNWDGDTSKDLPYLFAVNYKAGGEDDPVLTYNDQLNEDGTTIMQGLMRRFFLPRLAVFRHGVKMESYMKLDLIDVTNWLHREMIYFRNAKYYITNIDDFKPLLDRSTKVTLWRYHPITPDDIANCFPSEDSLTSVPITNSFDIKYQPLLLFNTDLPK